MVLFFIDIMISLFKQFYDQGNLIIDTKKCIFYNLTSIFIFDIFLFMMFIAGVYSDLRILSVFFVFRQWRKLVNNFRADLVAYFNL